MNALVQQAGHRSVGASTAVFGAVGILAALSLVRYRHHLQRRWPLPVAAALALLAVMGTEGKNTDLGAHFFGFVYGFFLGLVTEYLVGRHGRPGWKMNALFVTMALSAVIWGWYMALRFSS